MTTDLLTDRYWEKHFSIDMFGETTMKQGITAIQIPGVLHATADKVDELYTLFAPVPAANEYLIDMTSVDFVRPYGVVALALALRRLSTLTGQPICLRNLTGPVHSYLDRMNFFDVCKPWLSVLDTLDEEWARKPQTPNLLELTKITGPKDVEAIVCRASLVFSRWLEVPNLNSLLTAISELCANVYQHSGDEHGCVLLQKYEHATTGEAVVCMAVGDLGCGVQGSLESRYGKIGKEALEYLEMAMEGKSARETRRGGLGLRIVRGIAESIGGYLWLRSSSAAILVKRGGSLQTWTGLVNVPGTQVALELRSPLPH